MNIFLSQSTKVIFLMLGGGCNLKCKYCLQTPANLPEQLQDEVSPNVIEFIKERVSSQNDKDPITIQGYGGEPLLYWNKLQYIFDALKDTKNLTRSIISNGTLLTDEIVTYLNTNQINCTISWDGPNTKDLRGVNVLKDELIVEHLCKLERLSLSSVVNKYATPRRILDDAIPFMEKYHKSTGNHCSVNFDLIVDTGLQDKDLLDINYSEVYSEMKILTDELRKRMHNEEHNIYYAHHAGVLFNNLTHTVKNTKSFKRSICYCQNGYDIFNIDMAGNLYRCHNSSDIVGHVTDSYMTYLKNVILLDTTKDRVSKCEICPVVALCAYGCPLVDIHKDEVYCNLKKAMYLPIVELLMELGSEE